MVGKYRRLCFFHAYRRHRLHLAVSDCESLPSLYKLIYFSSGSSLSSIIFALTSRHIGLIPTITTVYDKYLVSSITQLLVNPDIFDPCGLN